MLSFPLPRTAFYRMATPDTWTISDVRDRIVKPTWLDVNRAFAEGDHLHAGTGRMVGNVSMGTLAGWMAPMPPPNHPNYRSFYDGVVRGFVSSNKVAEVQNRHKAGVVGRQPSRGFESKAPIAKGKEMTPELMRLKETADAWMAERWETEGMHTELQNAVAALLYAGRQPARLLLPRGFLVDGKDGARTLPRVQLPDMLKMLRLTYPKPEECTVYTDPDTFEEIGIFFYSRDGDTRAEVTWVDRSTGFTHLRQINNDGTLIETRYDFGGLIPIFEMRRSPLITPQIIQNQMALNLALSSVPRNVWSASARERWAFNVDLPGKEVQVDGETVFQAEGVEIGASVLNNLNGFPIIDKDTGRVTGYTNPSMHVEDPVEVRPSKEAVDVHEWQILAEARQLHAIMSADATSSGISRIVARVEFMGSLTETKPTVDACLEWQANTRLAMAEAFTDGREGRRSPHPYTEFLRANAECKLDPGPITPEERTALDQLVASGLYSKETARALMGVEDVAEENRKAEAEHRTERIFALIERADSTGMDRYAVLTILGGVAPEEAKALARGDVVTGVTQ
jgi:hypothetical protein